MHDRTVLSSVSYKQKKIAVVNLTRVGTRCARLLKRLRFRPPPLDGWIWQCAVPHLHSQSHSWGEESHYISSCGKVSLLHDMTLSEPCHVLLRLFILQGVFRGCWTHLVWLVMSRTGKLRPFLFPKPSNTWPLTGVAAVRQSGLPHAHCLPLGY